MFSSNTAYIFLNLRMKSNGISGESCISFFAAKNRVYGYEHVLQFIFYILPA